MSEVLLLLSLYFYNMLIYADLIGPGYLSIRYLPNALQF
jgi:hypothetical protein